MIEEVEHRIRERAHGIWEREGRPSDRAEAHWFQAAAELFAEKAPRAAAQPRGARKTAPAEASSEAAPAPRRRAAKAKPKA